MAGVPLTFPVPDSGQALDRDPTPRLARRLPLSVVIPTLNESAQIGAAVNDLSWANEVIVVDGGSSDNTVGLAQAAGARTLVVHGETIAAQRNAGIAIAQNRWILALDADERVSAQLRMELSQVVAGLNPTHVAYRMKFRNHYLGKELRHGPWGRDWHVRLFTAERRYVCHRVHEHLEPIEDVGTLTGPVVHRPYTDLAHHVSKIVKYARWGADDLYSRGRRAGLWEMTARPAWRFIRDYVVFSGWRDGGVGFVAAALGSFAAFLKYAFLFARSQTPRA
ncbi:MAG TPA: glycosyltransferase family 2 protein [Gemmatimonadaceae bacterium]|jgi:glycosyltransferase involved in cell wall biosynthesis|nr:glycosyltransferase family 2 protein [Gemmatimonadaceae bacterium]